MNSPREKEPLAKALETIFDSFMRGKVHICMPGIVTAFTADEENGITASVQPALQQLVKGREPENRTILDNIPVLFPSSNDYGLVVELKEGDEVALFFGERSMAAWLASGGIVLPDDPRTFDLSDAFAVPGLHSRAHKITSVEPGITIKKLDGSVSLNVNESLITANVGEMNFEVEADGVKAKPVAVVPVEADVKAYSMLEVDPPVAPAPGYVSLARHTHQVISLGAPSGPPIPKPGAP